MSRKMYSMERFWFFLFCALLFMALRISISVPFGFATQRWNDKESQCIVPCPRVCAIDETHCPEGFAPCGKIGLCEFKCASNPLWIVCLPNQSRAFPAYDQFTVNVTKIGALLRSAEVVDLCASHVELLESRSRNLARPLPNYAKRDITYMLDSVTTTDEIGISFEYQKMANEPIWYAFLACLVATVSLVLFFVFGNFLFSSTKTKIKRKRKTALDSCKSVFSVFSKEPFSPQVSSKHSNFNDAATISYYATSKIGLLAYYALVIYSFFIQVMLLFTVIDYYRVLDGYFTIFIKEPLYLDHYFIVLWLFMFFTGVAWKISGNARVRCFFLIRVDCIANADYVCVASSRKTIPLSTSVKASMPRFILKFIQIFSFAEKSLDKFFGIYTKFTIHRVHVSKGHGLRYFTHNCLRFVYNTPEELFQIFTPNTTLKISQLLKCAESRYVAGGLCDEIVATSSALFGSQNVLLRRMSFLDIWTTELSGFFYLYQFSMLWVWFYFAYWKMALLLFIAVVSASLKKAHVNRRAHLRMCDLASFSCPVSVLRNNERLLAISSSKLVPGDIVELTPGIVPCDLLLCRGEMVLDESSLTGEAQHVRKFPMLSSDQNSLDLSSLHSHHKHVLLAGTLMISADKGAYAVVLATGALTSRGTVIRNMLRPQNFLFVFDEQLRVVLLVLLVWASVCAVIVAALMKDHTLSWWFYAVFMITEVVSPLLPAVLVAGQAVAADRLHKNYGIFCANLSRITMSGKTKIICFDKTGTLTKTGQVVWGFVSEPNSMTTNPEFIPTVALCGLATCHSLTLYGNQIIGNPVDVSMFDFSGYKISNTNNNEIVLADISEETQTVEQMQPRPCCINILKRFEFLHSLQTMAVIVNATCAPNLAVEDNKNKSNEENDDADHISLDNSSSFSTRNQSGLDCDFKKSQLPVRVFVKGSPEKIFDMCSKIPVWCKDTYHTLAKDGCYVLALATKNYDILSSSSLAIDSIDRAEVECNLTFAGFVVFRNPLKEDSPAAIAKLQHGGCHTVMITGDNIFTGISIATTCGIIKSCTNSKINNNDDKIVDNVHYAQVNDTNNEIEWHNLTTGNVIDSSTLEKEIMLNQTSGNVTQVKTPLVCLAVCGRAWTKLCQRNLAERYLMHIAVWARMTPDQKSDVVQRMMEHGITAMCGDGGNDCEAINAAHVGIAMSDSIAAVAAPFSTAAKSVHVCVDVLREGRAALASSFAGYKFLIMYGMTMTSMCLTMYYFSVVLNEYIWIMIDGVIVVTTCSLLVRAKACAELSPKRPTVQLLGLQTVLSVIAQTMLHWLFLGIGVAILWTQKFYQCAPFDKTGKDSTNWWLRSQNYEAAVISCLVVGQYVNNGAVFNYGHKFRQTWIKNHIFVVFYFVALLLVSVLILGPNTKLSCFFEINCQFRDEYGKETGTTNVFPTPFRYKVFALTVANIAACHFVERFFILGPVREWLIRTKKSNKVKNI